MEVLRRILDWLEPPRRLSPTRAGWWFVAGVLAVGFAAVNTGNNLLYFVLGMMLGAIVVSGILSERNLRGLSIARAVPPDVQAGDPATLAYVVHAARRRLPVLALEIRDRDGDGRFGPAVRLARVDPGRTRRRAYERVFPSRGVREVPEIEIATTFPFGLFRKSRRLPIASQVRVRPRVPDLDTEDAFGGRQEGDDALPTRGEGLELFGLRDYVAGDDARRIHWKATARTGRAIVKETAREEPPVVVIRLDLSGGDPAPAIERAVERAAGLAAAYLRGGYGVGLLAAGHLVPPAAGPGARDAILDALVDVRAGDAPGPHPLDPRVAVVPVVPRGRAAGNLETDGAGMVRAIGVGP